MTTLLMVCTGNICRSPAAQYLLTQAVGEPVKVTSAGTRALAGRGIPAPMLELLETQGIDGSDHRATQLTADLVRAADLVVAMTRKHRTLAAQTESGALRRTFTLAELATAAETGAQLTGDGPEERLASLPAAVAAHRAVLARYPLDDVPDPYLGSNEAYRKAFSRISRSSQAIAQWLSG